MSSNSTSSSSDSPLADDILIAAIASSWAVTIISIFVIFRIRKFLSSTPSKIIINLNPKENQNENENPKHNGQQQENNFTRDDPQDETSPPTSPSEDPSASTSLITPAENDEFSTRNWIISSKDITVHDVIGTGSMGRVYIGKWRGLQIAIKEMLSTAKEDELSKNINLLIKVRHPNLVLFMGVAQPSVNKFWIISEYMSRGNLYSLLHDYNTKIDWKRKVSMALDIARAVNYLHFCKPTILHKSLNSLNILVDREFVAKVSDYGLDVMKSVAKSSVSIVTQPLWSSPEVLKKNKFSTKSDAYSFAILLWEICTRRTPYAGKISQGNTVKNIQMISEGMRPEFPPSFPPPLQTLISSCWHNDASKRPEFSEIVSRLLEMEKEKYTNEMLEMKDKDPHEDDNMIQSNNINGNDKGLSLSTILSTTERKPWMIDLDELKFSTLIGKGSFGEVYEGEFRGKKVAIKKLSINMRDSNGSTKNYNKRREEMIQSFIRELNIMCSLRHPNVILFIGACLHPDTPCIVMEFCDKGNLYQTLHDKSVHIDYNLILKILIQSAEGILYLHLNNPPILHRDLKSLNLLVDADFNIKVADFGLTQIRGEEEKKNPIKNESKNNGEKGEKGAGGNGDLQLGTSLWLAPEAMENSSSFTEKSDVYSFGIIIWELFTREIPFKELNSHQAALAVLTEDKRPTIPSFVPPKFSALISACWDKSANVRPNFQQIIHTLKELKREGLPRIELSLQNAKLYRKKLEVFAFKSKDAVIVYKSWGTGEGKKGDWVIVGPQSDIYTCDAHIFGKTYARVSDDRPHVYRKTEAIYALEMKNDFLMETLEGMEHGSKGDFIAQNPVDGEQWPIGRNTFLMMYGECEEQKLSVTQLMRIKEKEKLKETTEMKMTNLSNKEKEEEENKNTNPATSILKDEKEEKSPSKTLPQSSSMSKDKEEKKSANVSQTKQEHRDVRRAQNANNTTPPPTGAPSSNSNPSPQLPAIKAKSKLTPSSSNVGVEKK